MKDERLRFGVYLGLTQVLITLVIYLIDPKMLVNSWTGLISMLCWLAFLIFGAIRVRKLRGGYLTYGSTFLACLNIFILGTLLYSLFYQTLLTVDKDLPDILKAETISKIEKSMAGFGAPEAEVERVVSAIEAEDMHPNLTSFFKQLLGNFAIGLVISLILAIFLRKEKPIFD